MATQPNFADVKAAITTYLTSNNVPPTQAWIRDFMPTIRLNTPVVALQKTALFRLLAVDLTTSIQVSSNNALPVNISSPEAKERKLAGPITVQILDIEDIGHSRWSQVESIEAQERGETTKGREIIRVVPDETNVDSNNQPTTGANSAARPYKLLLQDAKGTKVYGFELDAVQGINVNMAIGSKLVLRNATVARGVVLLEPKGVELLGGKVEAWDKQWRTERKEILKRKAGMSEEVG